MDYEARLAELQRGLSQRDTYEWWVIQQIVNMPQGMRDTAYEQAMRNAPPQETVNA